MLTAAEANDFKRAIHDPQTAPTAKLARLTSLFETHGDCAGRALAEIGLPPAAEGAVRFADGNPARTAFAAKLLEAALDPPGTKRGEETLLALMTAAGTDPAAQSHVLALKAQMAETRVAVGEDVSTPASQTTDVQSPEAMAADGADELAVLDAQNEQRAKVRKEEREKWLSENREPLTSNVPGQERSEMERAAYLEHLRKTNRNIFPPDRLPPITEDRFFGEDDPLNIDEKLVDVPLYNELRLLAILSGEAPEFRNALRSLRARAAIGGDLSHLKGIYETYGNVLDMRTEQERRDNPLSLVKADQVLKTLRESIAREANNTTLENANWKLMTELRLANSAWVRMGDEFVLVSQGSPILDRENRPIRISAEAVASLVHNPRDRKNITEAAERDTATRAGSTRFETIFGDADTSGKNQRDLVKPTGELAYTAALELNSTFGTMIGPGFQALVEKHERDVYGATHPGYLEEMELEAGHPLDIIKPQPPISREELRKQEYYSEAFESMWDETWSPEASRMMAEKFNRVVSLVAVLQSCPKEELEKFKANNIVKVYLENTTQDFINSIFSGRKFAAFAAGKLVPVPILSQAVSKGVNGLLKHNERNKKDRYLNKINEKTPSHFMIN